MPEIDQGATRPHLPPTRSNTLVGGISEVVFALDFEYEEWAAPYRDWLHASYLEIVERAVNDDIETGHFERGINLARRVLDVDPHGGTRRGVFVAALSRERGARGRAEHTPTTRVSLREQLGVEPPPLDFL